MVVQVEKDLAVMQEPWVQPLDWEDNRRRARQLTPVFLPGEFY